LSFADASIGTQVEVPTLDGKVRIKIPPGTQSGKIFRLQDKGLPSVQGYGKGDQLIHVNVWTPKKLTNEERELLEKMRSMPNFTPSPEKSDRTLYEKLRDYFK
jgi:molecular chaperone DnaJ